MTTITYTERLTVVTCTCGINFAIPDTLNEQALNRRGPTGKHIYCPLGHTWYYTGKTEAERLSDQLEEERRKAVRLQALIDQERARGDGLERRRRAAVGQVTRIKRRVAAGVCPSCNRSFENLARHMASKHPDFAGEVHTHESVSP